MVLRVIAGIYKNRGYWERDADWLQHWFFNLIQKQPHYLNNVMIMTMMMIIIITLTTKATTMIMIIKALLMKNLSNDIGTHWYC